MNNDTAIDSEESRKEMRSQVAGHSEHYVPQPFFENVNSRFFLTNGRETLDLIASLLASTAEEVTLERIQQSLLSPSDLIEEVLNGDSGVSE